MGVGLQHLHAEGHEPSSLHGLRFAHAVLGVPKHPGRSVVDCGEVDPWVCLAVPRIELQALCFEANGVELEALVRSVSGA
eukprot:7328791-Alexandrium_andersonii.AAC.1